MFSLSRKWVISFMLSAVPASIAVAGPPPSYGHDFVTIGDPGNRPVNQDEGPRFFPPYATKDFGPVGRVNYRYRMARTEVTVGQWFDFVNAYAPYNEGPINDLAFTSSWIYYDHGDNQYHMIAGAENFAADMGWRFAARYCNWLQNGKSMDREAFENGAYDASTFTDNPDGSFNDQLHHNPNALYWIPTLDEWTKAMHWDPAKNGEGGYWRYPTSSDDAPIVGAPGVGETNAGSGAFYDVGAYADVMSPWGLLDGSGGETEWLEFADVQAIGRGTRGSSWALPTFFDPVDYLNSSFPFAPGGFRLVSAIPAPSSAVPLVILCVFFRSPRKRRNENAE